MIASKKAINLIKKWEGLSLKPYLCPAGVPTIGYGATYYQGGIKVKLTDLPITEKEAEEMLVAMIIPFAQAVDSYTTDKVNQNQFDALVSFAYNVGTNALKNSTLLGIVNKNPNDSKIRTQFMRWVRSNGKILKGLQSRRQEEADLYFY
jgi:lysozyme